MTPRSDRSRDRDRTTACVQEPCDLPSMERRFPLLGQRGLVEAELAAEWLADHLVELDRSLVGQELQQWSHHHFVPVPLQPDTEVDSTLAWSWTRREPRYLPTAFCYLNAPQPEVGRICIRDSNGSAAGNTIEEAVLQGFLELVERDAAAIWWYNRVRRPEVDLASFAVPYLERLETHLASRGREIWVLDLTIDLGIPVFAAIARETAGPEERFMVWLPEPTPEQGLNSIPIFL
jgi:thiazole/oxazole-forming peptide maturase SagD family component